MTPPEPSPAALVERHYDVPALQERLLAALAAAGRDPDALTRDDLAPFEELHVRGREATRELAVLAGLAPGMEVLDVGCGVGGPARTLAAEFGCRVTGLDLVEAYVRAAADLTARVGLAGHVAFVHADALALPWEAPRFDAAVLAHVTMNVEDTRRLLAGVARVLRPGGRLALYEVCAGVGGPPDYPLPWASDPAISFLEPPSALLGHVEAAGFAALACRDASAASLAWFRRVARPSASPLGTHLLMGPEADARSANLARCLEDGRVRVVQIVGTLPEGPVA